LVENLGFCVGKKDVVYSFLASVGVPGTRNSVEALRTKIHIFKALLESTFHHVGFEATTRTPSSKNNRFEAKHLDSLATIDQSRAQRILIPDQDLAITVVVFAEKAQALRFKAVQVSVQTKIGDNLSVLAELHDAVVWELLDDSWSCVDFILNKVRRLIGGEFGLFIIGKLLVQLGLASVFSNFRNILLVRFVVICFSFNTFVGFAVLLISSVHVIPSMNIDHTIWVFLFVFMFARLDAWQLVSLFHTFFRISVVFSKFARDILLVSILGLDHHLGRRARNAASSQRSYFSL
jgi:hypothetical protein